MNHFSLYLSKSESNRKALSILVRAKNGKHFQCHQVIQRTVTAQVPCRCVSLALMSSTVCHLAALKKVGSYLLFFFPFDQTLHVDNIIINTLNVIMTIVKDYSLCPHHCMSSLLSTLFIVLYHNHYLVFSSVVIHCPVHNIA